MMDEIDGKVVPYEIKMEDLPERQQRFIEAYLRLGNITQSAIAAGYTVASAGQQGSELLKLPQISAIVEREKSSLAARAAVKAEEILQEIKHLAYSNITKAFTLDFRVKSLDEIPEELQRCIQEIQVKEQETKEGVSRNVKVKFYDKIRALELLGKYKNLWDKADAGAGFTLVINQAIIDNNANSVPNKPVDMDGFVIDVPFAQLPENTGT